MKQSGTVYWLMCSCIQCTLLRIEFAQNVDPSTGPISLLRSILQPLSIVNCYWCVLLINCVIDAMHNKLFWEVDRIIYFHLACMLSSICKLSNRCVYRLACTYLSDVWKLDLMLPCCCFFAAISTLSTTIQCMFHKSLVNPSDILGNSPPLMFLFILKHPIVDKCLRQMPHGCRVMLLPVLFCP